MKSLNFLLLLFSLILIRSTIKVTLNSSPEVIITYSFPQSDTIRITLEANSQGFIGLGFGSQMAGTNIILLYKENGNFVAKDTTASGHVVPTSHTIQNVVLIEGTRNTSWTTATFERKLNTGASEDYTITPFSPTPLIWALGSSDTLIQHVNYGSTIHTFLQCDSSCLTCSGPLASNCASCESGKTLNNSQCSLICDASCLTCDSTSSTKCTSCDSSHELIGEACVALTCDSTCLTCSGTTANNCSSCANGKYLAADLSCLACHSACLTCSGGLYNQCLSCNTSLYSLNNDGGCVIPYTTCSLVNGSSCFSYRLSSNPVLNINYSLPTSDSIQITMEYYTQGFIAMGFGESMSSADVILANMTNSIMNLSDRTATRRGLPSLDPVQSAQLLSSYRTTEKTVITYLRKLDTNQVNNTVIALSKTTPLIWCYGTSDTLSYHGNTRRGATFVSFFPCHFSCKTCQGSLSSDCLSCNEDLRIMNEGSCVLINTLWGVGWYSVVLNQTPLIRLNYSYISAEKLSFTMEYHTQGFISLGFGYNMSQADIALSYMVNGTGFLQDSYSNKRSKPTADAIQNLELKYWARDSSKTVVNFQRALNTGEADDYFLKANITTPIIWAYGSTDTVSYHMTNRGKTFIAFQQTTIGKSCTSNCKDCYGPQADQCVSCMSGYFLTNNQCLACDSTCSECSGPGNNQCITCSVQNRIPSNGTCVATISSIKLNDIPLIYLNYSFPESNKIEIMLEFHTQGYIAIGFGNTMSNSDMILAYKSNDQFVVRSARASGNVEPVENSVQNMNITSSSRDSEKTIVTFQRKLSYERLLQSSTTSLVTLNINTDIPLIWSYGSSDTLELHVKEGERIIQFQQIKCDISCLTCSGSSNNQCTSCNSSSELINGICQQYKCDSSCLTCFGNGTNECLSCASQRFLENGRCVSSISELLNDLNSDLEVTNQFYMYWKFNSNNTVTIALRWNTGGYIALGFGKSMDGMDIISTEYQNGILKVYDRWASSESSPPTDSALGGKDDLTLISSVNSDSQGFAIVKFNRALNTNDSYDYIIKQQTEEFCFAFTSDKTINFHGSNVRVFSFDFVDGFKGKANLENPDKSTLVQAHGIGLLICWSFLVDVSIMIIRYFKHIKNYVEIHATMFFIIDIFTLIIVFMMIAKNGDVLEFKFQSDKTITAHFALGVIVLNLIVFQHIFGFIIKKSIDSKKMNYMNSKLSQIKKIHRFLGYTIYIITKASVLTGLWIYDYEELFIGFCIYYGVLFITKILIEIIYQRYFSSKIVDIISPVVHKSEFNSLIDDLTSLVPLDKLIRNYPKLKWCLLNNSIYDLREFDHPGGKYIIEQINGREIGRFFFGAYALEDTNLKPYTHSVSAKQFLDKRHVGEFRIDEIDILQLIPAQNMTSVWKLVKKEKLSANTSKFYFSSKCCVVKNNVNGVEWFGRHFTVNSVNSQNQKVRLYTTILCLTEENIAFRKDLLDFFKSKMSKSEEIDKINLKAAPISQNLHLIIKRYDFPNSFSSFIHQSNHESFELQGPHGTGLGLTKNSNGNHIIFCGGTGIFPFLDLLDYLLKKSIYQILSSTIGKEIAEETNVFKEDFQSSFGLKFKVILYAAFQSKEEIEYLDFIIELYKINKKYNLELFDMILRFNDKTNISGLPTTDSYFDDKFFSENIVPDQCSKIFVCGNPKMNKLIPEICLRNQIEKEKIKLI